MNADDITDDTTEKYTDDQKKNDILLSRFQNISKYINTNDLPTSISYDNLADILIDDYDLAKFSNDRYEFYKEYNKIINDDPRILKQIININNKNKLIRKKAKKIIQKIKHLNYRVIKKDDEAGKIIDGELKKKLIEILKNKFTKMAGGGDRNANLRADIKEFLTHPSQSDDKNFKNFEKIKEKNFGSNYKIKESFNEMKEDIKHSNEKDLRKYFKDNGINNLDSLNQPIINNADDDYKYKNEQSALKKFISEYENAYKNDKDEQIFKQNLKNALTKLETADDNPLEVLKLTREDRLVFMLVTFFIRYITVLMVQWCIDINIIQDFYQGFLFYAFIYIVIFWFIIMFVNIDIPKKSYMDFDTGMGNIRNIFYYFYMGTNGITRLLTHSLLIIILLIIPILLNIKEKKYNHTEDNILDYEERKKLIKTLSLFTIFIWVLTSIIATKF